MPSPFPGMDPFIEACGRWEGFHSQLIGEIHRTLAAAVPERYFVDLQVRSYIAIAGTEDKELPPCLPDACIPASLDESTAKRTVAPIAEAMETEAVPMQAFMATEFRETFIEILESNPED